MDPNTPDLTQTPTDTSTATQAAAAPNAQETGKNVILPSQAFKRRLEQARNRGKAEATAEQDKVAQAKGFANYAAMMNHLDTLLAAPRQVQTPKPTTVSTATTSAKPTPPANRNDSRAMRQYTQELERWKRDNAKLSTQLAEEQKRRRNAERKADAVEAQANLERIATRAGIKDTAYAIHLFEQHHAGMTVEQLEQIDEAVFFQGLRKEHGYLFGETVVPATTGTVGAQPGSNSRAPGAVSTDVANKGKIDVRSMSKQQYAEYMRARGLDVNAAGLG